MVRLYDSALAPTTICLSRLSCTVVVGTNLMSPPLGAKSCTPVIEVPKVIFSAVPEVNVV